MPVSPEDSSGLAELYDALARLQGYERREAQVQMGHAILQAFHTGRHLISEVPTGVGKSLGYLVPIGLHLANNAGGRVVISTYSRALQVQLLQREIPLLSRLLGAPVRHALCLGSGNYLCLRRLDQITRFGLFDQGDLDEVRRLIAWGTDTKTGLLNELGATFRLWERVNRQPEFCGGRKCRFHGPCFFFAARNQAEQARLLITNHSLFFANMAAGERALPEFEAVLMDEAHQLEETAASYFGTEVHAAHFYSLADALHLPARKEGFLASLKSAADQSQQGFELLKGLRTAVRSWHRDLLLSYPATGRRVRLTSQRHAPSELLGRLDALSEYLSLLTPATEDEEMELTGLTARTRHLASVTEHLTGRTLDRHVYWIENRESGFRLGATPLDISAMMESGLFSRYRPVILTSGTLTTEGSFAFVKDRMGMHEADELAIESPYSFRERVVLYVPESMPDPSSMDYAGAVSDQLKDMRKRLPGGILILFTSYRLMHDVAALLEAAGISLLMQGQAPPNVLLEEFRASEAPLLLGTATFWQGIDLAQGNLKVVVITRLPFLAPDNPVVAAKIEELTASGSDAFNSYQVPSAVLMFRQGFGRLIRNSTGFGAVAVLDPRILNRPYGRRFLDSVPRCSMARTFDDVSRFLTRWG